jgi:manganese/zinc/iron transport system substrate-binding protein
MKILIGIGFVILSFLGGCRFSSADRKNDGCDLIVCTTSIIADCVRQLVPKNIEVVALMGAGVDPHMYKALPNDLKILDQADVVIVNGLHLEAKFDAVFKELRKSKTILTVADGMEEKNKISHGKKAYDPHIWFDLMIWNNGMHKIAEELGNIFPKYKLEILRNWVKFNNQAIHIDQSIQEKIQSLPANKRTLITSHDAFSYFGRRYRFKIKSVQGMNTMIESGLNDNKSLIDFIILNNVSAVFIETSVSSKSLKSIQEACRSRKHSIKLGTALCSDALGDPKSKEGSYFGMLESNVDKIINGLH